ncbi:CCA tRNA nucleotidyltransferase [Anderseniella sp. Alg231-50]|uniref:CCA tRNA nucleotidyltransferase n=1 Tax=Anderseniella sp. Alg231-50 TaxID=1922226 RepID=UPI000D558C40
MTLPSLHGHPIFETAGLGAVFQAIADAGGEARIVGGAVRNALLDEPVRDIDIATTLTPEQVLAAAAATGLKTVATGIEHGTVTVISDNSGFEVTTLRHDVETDGRKAKVAYTDDWAVDAARRDFTLNAFYCSQDGEVFDPMGGSADLDTRTVRFVGDPEARIREDYLRILRFFRFISQYGQDDVDADGLDACRQLKAGLKQLSRERVGQETCKLLCGRRAGEVAVLMNDTGINRTLFGADMDAVLLASVIARAGTLGGTPDYTTLLAAALPLGADEQSELLRLSNVQTRSLRDVQSALPPSPALRDNERKVVLYQTGAETWKRAVLLAWARDANAADEDWAGLYALPEQWEIPVFPVTGSDVLATGVAAGPQIGEALKALEDWWIAGGFVASREELLARLTA